VGHARQSRRAWAGDGEDVALAGFDDIDAADDVTPGLTSVRVPLEEVGVQAVRAALDDDWHPSPLSLTIHLRASTPPRLAPAG
jgi:LacI family transcriptional regulator